MGLDIKAYSQLRFVATEADDDNDLVHLWTAEGCPNCLQQPEGFYETDEASQSLRFRAGSYSGYGAWRKTLCAAALGVAINTLWASPADHAGQPFVELLNYSDCEGCFGREVSAKLATDFAAQRDHVLGQAAKLSEDMGWFSRLYDEWAGAFKLAANNGALLLY